MVNASLSTFFNYITLQNGIDMNIKYVHCINMFFIFSVLPNTTGELMNSKKLHKSPKRSKIFTDKLQRIFIVRKMIVTPAKDDNF